MFTSWSRHMGNVLHSQAYKQAVYVAAGSYCEILSVVEFIPVEADNADSSAIISPGSIHFSHQYTVEVALVGNYRKKIFVQTTFVLPSESPEVSLQDYRTVWEASIGAYCVTRRPRAPKQSVLVAAAVIPYEHKVQTRRQYTNEEIRALLQPIKFDWAEEMEENNEVPAKPRETLRISCVEEALGSDSSSDLGSNSQTPTPITPFSRGTSPTIPLFVDCDKEVSALFTFLDLAVTKKPIEPSTTNDFDWLNLIKHEKRWKLYTEKDKEPAPEQIWEAYKSRFQLDPCTFDRSGLVSALDLVVTRKCLTTWTSPLLDQLHLDVHDHAYWKHHGPTSDPDEETGPDGISEENAEHVIDEQSLKAEELCEAEKLSVEFQVTAVLEEIDLNAVFGGSADDLYEDYEARNRAARASIDTASHYQEDNRTCDDDKSLNNKHTNVHKAAASIDGHREPGWLSPQTWKYIPEDDNYDIMKYMENLPELSDTKKRFKLASEMFNWHHMYLATEVCKDRGWYKHEPLRAADRSGDWFWEPTNDDNRRPYDPQILADAAALSASSALRITATPKPHHLNFFQAPVYHKNDTTPEISLWLVHSGHSKDYPAVSYKGVLAAEAGKLIDPFVYNGPQKLLRLKGTKLRDAVTGYVDKVYHAEGTWLDDDYSMDEVQPKVIQNDNFTDKCSNAGRPQPTHVVTREEYRDNDKNVNDDGRFHWGYPIRGKERTQSNLFVSEFAHYEDDNDNHEENSKSHAPQLQDPPVHEITNESGSETDPPGPSCPVGLKVSHESEAELLSPQSHHPSTLRAIDISTVGQSPKVTGIVPQQSEDEVTVDNHDFYSGAVAPQSKVEEGETAPSVQSDKSDAQEALLAQINAEFCNRPEYLATLKLVAAISEGRPREEVAAIQAEKNEIYSSLPRNTYVYEYDEDEDREDYTNSWTRQVEPSAENAEYLAQWSEKFRHITAVQAPQQNPEGDDRDAGDCRCSPTDVRKCLSPSSDGIEDTAHSGDLEHEAFGDESEGIIAATCERGELPPRSFDHLDGGDGILAMDPVYRNEASAKDDIDCEEIRDSGEDCEDGEANSPIRTRRDESFFTTALLNSAHNDQLIAHIEDKFSDNEEPEEANVKGLASLFQEDAAREVSLRRDAKTQPLLTLEEEEALMHDAYVAGALSQEQADAQAEVLLRAYLGHLKRYHSMSWPTISNKVSSLEVLNTEAQSLPEQQDLCVGQFTMVSIPSSLPYPPPAVVPVTDCDTMVRKSYQYALSTLPSILEGEGADSDEPTDPASDLDCSTSGQSASEKLQICTEVDLAYFEEASENMEDGLVWDEDSEVVLEQDGEDTQLEHQSSDTQDHDKDDVSMSSENIADMNTENLDSLLSNVSGLLATFPGSDTVVQNLSAELITIPGICDDQEEDLDHDTLEPQQLAEEMEQLAAEARKLAAEAGKLAARKKEVVDRLEKLAGEEKLLADGKAQLAAENELADQSVENQKAEEVVIDHAFDNISCPSAIPLAKPTFNEHFFGSFAIAVGGKASRLVMGLSGVLRSSATVLHRG